MITGKILFLDAGFRNTIRYYTSNWYHGNMSEDLLGGMILERFREKVSDINAMKRFVKKFNAEYREKTGWKHTQINQNMTEVTPFMQMVCLAPADAFPECRDCPNSWICDIRYEYAGRKDLLDLTTYPGLPGKETDQACPARPDYLYYYNHTGKDVELCTDHGIVNIPPDNYAVIHENNGYELYEINDEQCRASYAEHSVHYPQYQSKQKFVRWRDLLTDSDVEAFLEAHPEPVAIKMVFADQEKAAMADIKERFGDQADAFLSFMNITEYGRSLPEDQYYNVPSGSMIRFETVGEKGEKNKGEMKDNE